MVRVRSAMSVEVQRTRPMPATITLQRAHRITLWPKNRSSCSACFGVRTSRTFDIGLTSLLLDFVEHLGVDTKGVGPPPGLAAGEQVAAQCDGGDHQQPREDGGVA